MSFRPVFRTSVLAASVTSLIASMAWSGQAAAAPLVVKEPNDPSHMTQWYLRDGPEGIGAYSAWAIAATQPQSQAVVGVIDTNIELDNKELKNRLVTGWDGRNNQPYPLAWLIVTSMHGTMVAGTLAGEANNSAFGTGAAGTAPVKVMPLKYVNPEDMCGTGVKKDADYATAKKVYQGLVASMRYALDHNARVINISSVTPVSPVELNDPLHPLYPLTQQITALFKEAETRGVLVVSSAGNSHYNADRLATESQIAIQGWNALSDRDAACPAPRFSMTKWESELTTEQRNAWKSGQPFDLAVKSGLFTYNVKVTAETAVAKGSILLPGGYSKAPFNYKNMLTVAGSDQTGKMWKEECAPGQLDFAKAMNDQAAQICGGSTYGSFVDIAAPSKDILVQSLGLALNQSGTSFATPMVSAAAGLALTVRPNLNAVQLKAAITEGVSAARITPTSLTPDDILKMPRMLASSVIGIPNPNAPVRLKVPTAPVWNSTTRAYAFSDTAFSDNGSLVRWNWTFGDGTTASTTVPSVNHAFALNGTYPVGLTVTDNQGNQRSLTQSAYFYGNTRDQVKLQLDGASPYSLNGTLVSGNLIVRDGSGLYQRVIEGTGVVRDTATGRNVTVTFNVRSNLLGYVAAGQVDVTDPVRGKMTVTLSNGTLTSDRSIDQSTCTQTGLTGQTFTGVTFTVRDTDN